MGMDTQVIGCIGQALKRFRLKKGLTQRQLALLAEVAESEVCRVETGQRQPRFITLHKLCKALHVSFDDLGV